MGRMNRMHIRDMRLERGWSQEQLAELTGLSVRTIQRIENGQEPGLASARALAEVFGVDIASVSPPAGPDWMQQPFLASVRTCLMKYSVVDGRADRGEYWWFVLFVGLITSIAALISEVAGSVVFLLLLVPLVTAGARRLHDTGHSGWWQLFALAPLGFVVPLVILVQPTVDTAVASRQR